MFNFCIFVEEPRTEIRWPFEVGQLVELFKSVWTGVEVDMSCVMGNWRMEEVAMRVMMMDSWLAEETRRWRENIRGRSTRIAITDLCQLLSVVYVGRTTIQVSHDSFHTLQTPSKRSESIEETLDLCNQCFTELEQRIEG